MELLKIPVFAYVSLFLIGVALGAIRYSYYKSKLCREYRRQLSDLASLAQVGELSFGFVHDMASSTTLLLHYAKEISAEMNRRGGRDGEAILPYSKGIERATSRLVKMQKTFRAMLKNESRSAPAPTDLRESIQGCVELFQPFLEKHRIRIEVHSSDGDSVSVTESEAVERIILNLLQNSVNALLGRENRKIEIRLDSRSEGSNLLFVGDTGPGIPEERLSRLWEKFGHSSSAERLLPGGSGFGLYKVKQLVDSIGGEICVQTSHQGTEFKIAIPKRTSIAA
jgi:signal transduction histidine kinase